MKDIIICGAGGFGREVACLINIVNMKFPMWNIVGFTDSDEKLWGTSNRYGNILGDDSIIEQWNSAINVVIAIGNPQIVKKIVNSIHNPYVSFPNIIHPDFNCVDKKSFSIGKGNIIQGGCSVSCDVCLGDFNVFNGSVVFGHDDKVGNFNSFMPDIRVSGEVSIGDCNFFGVGSIILQQIKIGNNIRLGAGSVLMTKPKDGNLYMGVPAKKIEL